MAEERNVEIEIESLIEDIDDNGLTEDSSKTVSKAKGILRSNGGLTLIRYTETEEGEKSECEILIAKSSVTVRRKGRANYDFRFEEGKTFSTLYTVPPFSFDTDIYTRKIVFPINEENQELSLLYDMTIGGAKKKTKMKVRVQ